MGMAETLAVVTTAAIRCTVSSMGCGPWLQFAPTTFERLGYAVDDRFYGVQGEGHLARFRERMHTLTVNDVNAALKAASEGAMKGILQFSTEELVSIDFKGNPHSSIVDAPYTKVMDGDFVKVLSWYDNEWGYSNRCVDLLRLMVKRGI